MVSRRLLPALALLVAAGFAVGLVRLFSVGFEAGDAYPPYSSLRTDPLGTRVLYDSLAELGRAPVRNYRLVPPVGEEPTTLLYLGLPRQALHWADPRAVEAVEQAARKGGRVVLCLLGESPPGKGHPRTETDPQAPDGKSPARESPVGEPQVDEPQTDEPPGETPETPPWMARRAPLDLEKRWGFRVVQPNRGGGPPTSAVALLVPREAGPERRIPWRSALAFEDLAPEWRTLYTVDGEVAVAERDWGAGTLVLCADSYPISNEGLWQHRAPEFVSWLLGSAPVTTFDEAHLGIVETPGVASVARELGLLGALPALIVLFLLFAWQRGSALGGSLDTSPPAREEGRDSTEALVSLLRRSVPPPELLDACVREWERIGAPAGPRGEALRRRVRTVLDESRRKDPVAAYRAAARVLAVRGTFRPEPARDDANLKAVPEGGEG